ncbi:hypothetical protein HXZ66_02105 [Bacillus sp. A116_S68]|nr:hypothetical protein HXZ66_02105 [Bacillus sp. A116_S68]
MSINVTVDQHGQANNLLKMNLWKISVYRRRSMDEAFFTGVDAKTYTSLFTYTPCKSHMFTAFMASFLSFKQK